MDVATLPVDTEDIPEETEIPEGEDDPEDMSEPPVFEEGEYDEEKEAEGIEAADAAEATEEETKGVPEEEPEEEKKEDEEPEEEDGEEEEEPDEEDEEDGEEEEEEEEEDGEEEEEKGEEEGSSGFTGDEFGEDENGEELDEQIDGPPEEEEEEEEGGEEDDEEEEEEEEEEDEEEDEDDDEDDGEEEEDDEDEGLEWPEESEPVEDPMLASLLAGDLDEATEPYDDTFDDAVRDEDLYDEFGMPITQIGDDEYVKDLGDDALAWPDDDGVAEDPMLYSGDDFNAGYGMPDYNEPDYDEPDYDEVDYDEPLFDAYGNPIEENNQLDGYEDPITDDLFAEPQNMGDIMEDLAAVDAQDFDDEFQDEYDDDFVASPVEADDDYMMGSGRRQTLEDGHRNLGEAAMMSMPQISGHSNDSVNFYAVGGLFGLITLVALTLIRKRRA